ncbi:MAG: hypothetical protein J6K96_06910 [Treponema sp.]|nr:hypothetical protein [Treponema sp.]
MSGLLLSKETQKNISRVIGVDYVSVVNYEPSEEMSLVGRMPVFSKKRDLKKIGRGNPLLSRHKIRTMDDVDKKLSRIK